MSKLKDIRKEFARTLVKAIDSTFSGIRISKKEVALSIVASREGHGDFGSSIAFRISKLAHKNPSEVAEAMVKEMRFKKPLSRIAHENGYINVWLDEKEYSRNVIGLIIKEADSYGNSKIGKMLNAVIEFPSVNPNKPWHIGHLRNALLGDSISNIFSKCSYHVERQDYIDDMGLQMAEILWGQLNLRAQPDKKYDQFLGEQYVQINKIIQERKIENEINELLKKMEDTSSAEHKRIREIAERSVRAQYETAMAYGVYHDLLIWESDILQANLLKEAMQILDEKGITEKPSKGKYASAVVIGRKAGGRGEEEARVLIRSNGIPTYLAKDIAFHMWKLGLLRSRFKYKSFIEQPNGRTAYSSTAEGKEMEFRDADIAINVIGSAQKYPQEILKKIFKAIAKKKAESIIHLSYGEVDLKDGNLSGRTGGWLGKGRNYTADDLLKEVNAKALQIVRQSDRIKGTIQESNYANLISKKVALSAIKFEFLRTDPEKKILFEWDRALNLESNSGPYCMYTYARALRILEKGRFKGKKPSRANCNEITRGVDFELVKMLGDAQYIIEKACRELKPNIIASYLIDLSILFSGFYETMPVIKGGEAKKVRLALVFCTLQVIKNMLALLGIEPAEAM